MELKTSVIKNGDSYYIRVPPAMVEYFKLTNGNLPKEAKIKDITDKIAQVSFPLW